MNTPNQLNLFVKPIHEDGCPCRLCGTPVHLFERIVAALDQNIPAGEIANGLGLNKAQFAAIVQKVTPFYNSDGRFLPLAQAIKDGTIKRGVAEMLLKVDGNERDECLRIFTETGKLTANDIEQLRHVQKERAVTALPDALFADDLPHTEAQSGIDAVVAASVRQWRTFASDAEIRAAFEKEMEEK